jgi:hypothetical protein
LGPSQRIPNEFSTWTNRSTIFFVAKCVAKWIATRLFCHYCHKPIPVYTGPIENHVEKRCNT